MTEHDPAQTEPAPFEPAEPEPIGLPPYADGMTASRRKPLAPVVVLAVVFFLVTGAFGTLWILERDAHRASDSELVTVRTEAADTKAKLAKTESSLPETENKIKESGERKKKNADEAAANRPCAEAGRELRNATSQDTVRAAMRLIRARCQ